MKTMPSARLIELLQARRENDVRILVPLPGGETVRLEIRAVAYNSLADDIEIRTEPWWWKDDDEQGGERQGSGLPEALRGDGPCNDCGTRDNIIWFTDSTLWNAVIRPHGEVEADPFLCTTCFVIRVDLAGLRPTGWRLIPDWRWESVERP